MGSPRKVRPMCEQCREKPVSGMRNQFCSRGCAAYARWQRMRRDGTTRTFEALSSDARKQKHAQRIDAESRIAAEHFGLEWSESVRKFYIYARNRGYRNGYTTRDARSHSGILP